VKRVKSVARRKAYVAMVWMPPKKETGFWLACRRIHLTGIRSRNTSRLGGGGRGWGFAHGDIFHTILARFMPFFKSSVSGA